MDAHLRSGLDLDPLGKGALANVVADGLPERVELAELAFGELAFVELRAEFLRQRSAFQKD